jgi:AcrR family transcriptional regulator
MSSVRRRNPKGSGEQLRAELVAAAARLVDTLGDGSKVTLRGVAGAVGVAPTAVYLHFADRDELMIAVLEDRFDAFTRQIDDAGAGIGDPLEALRRRGVAYIHFAMAQPGAYRMMFSHVGVELDREDLFKRSIAAGMPSYDSLVRAVTACVDAGALRGDPKGLANVGWGVVHGYADLAAVGVPFLQPPEEYLGAFLGAMDQRR